MRRDLFAFFSHKDQWHVVNGATQETVVVTDSQTKCAIACAVLNANPGAVISSDDLRSIMSCTFEV